MNTKETNQRIAGAESLLSPGVNLTRHELIVIAGPNCPKMNALDFKLKGDAWPMARFYISECRKNTNGELRRRIGNFYVDTILSSIQQGGIGEKSKFFLKGYIRYAKDKRVMYPFELCYDSKEGTGIIKIS